MVSYRKNLYRLIEVPFHSLEIEVWVVISQKRIVDSIYFFFDENVNAQVYVNILTQFIWG